MKHTPGPWLVKQELAGPWTCGDARTAIECGEEIGHTEILTPIGNGDETIAYVVWEPLVGEERQAELRQNIYLIAAAPEMLALLRDIVGGPYRDDDGNLIGLDNMITGVRILLERIDQGAP